MIRSCTRRLFIAIICTTLLMLSFAATAFAEADKNMPLISNYHGHSDTVTSISFSPDSNILAAGSEDKTVKLYFRDSDKQPLTLVGHDEGISKVEFSPDSSLLATASEDGMIKLWNINDTGGIKVLKGHVGTVNSMAFSSDGKTLYSCSNDKTIKFWNTETGEEITTAAFNTQVTDIKMNYFDNTLIAAFRDGSISILNSESGEVLKQYDDIIASGDRSIDRLSFSPDYKYVICSNRSIRQPVILDAEDDYKKIDIAEGQFNYKNLPVWSDCIFNSDGSYIIASDKISDHVIMFNFKTGDIEKTIDIHPTCLSASMDGSALAVGNILDDVNIYDVTAFGDPKLQAIKIKQSDDILRSGEAAKLELIGHYSDGTDKVLDGSKTKWQLNNQEAAVINNGVIFCKKPGKIAITASYEGLNFTQLTNIYGDSDIAYQNIFGVCSSDSNYVVVGAVGIIRSSAEGNLWIGADSQTKNDLKSVAYGSNLFVAAGDAGTILTSPDGKAWSKVPPVTSESIDSVIWDGSEFRASGKGISLSSKDGISWVQNNN